MSARNVGRNLENTESEDKFEEEKNNKKRTFRHLSFGVLLACNRNPKHICVYHLQKTELSTETDGSAQQASSTDRPSAADTGPYDEFLAELRITTLTCRTRCRLTVDNGYDENVYFSLDLHENYVFTVCCTKKETERS